MAGVVGFDPAQSGQTPVDINGNPVPVGVWGDSTIGVGVFGTSGNQPGNIRMVVQAGVVGHSLVDNGIAGESISGVGVIGRSNTGNGVQGVTFVPSKEGEPPSASGVFGTSVVGGDGVVGFVGDATGVVGNSIRGIGVLGITRDDDGVSGQSLTTGDGVSGQSETGNGVHGRSSKGHGVHGIGGVGTDGEIAAGVRGVSSLGFGVQGVSSSNYGIVGNTFGGSGGVSGSAWSDLGIGVQGVSILGDGVDGFSFTDVGVRGEGLVGVRGEGRNGGVHGVSRSANFGGIIGENPNGLAGIFFGKVRVLGLLFKAGGGFEIDHPLDPQNKYLRHSFVESPEMLNVYSGNVITDARGEALVTLPDYFDALNQEFRYQLTVIGQFAHAIVAREIRRNQFRIKSDKPRVKVSWQVSGIRKDQWAVANRIPVEAEKMEREKGQYLHPKRGARPGRAGKKGNVNQRATPQTDRLRRVTDMLPKQLRSRVQQHLKMLLRGDRLDRKDWENLVGEARQLVGPQAPKGRPLIDRRRLEAAWRRVQASIQRNRPAASRNEGEA
jgi:hypothetical protein